jgi:hypothetical protein
MIADISVKERSRIAGTQEQLAQLFGSFKAEWLKDKIFDLFKEPSYFPDLTTASPCVLIGGRGTGKTTVLRCLSYEGQFALSGLQSQSIPSWNYYGMYYRVNTNHVTAFTGDELEHDRWIKLFAHYFNLHLCGLVFKFLNWYSINSAAPVELSESACLKIGRTLHLPGATTIRQVEEHVENSRIEFEAYINNVADDDKPKLSMQTAPVDALMEALLDLDQFRGKNFFFLLDEYENFLDYQQQVVNTYIKHSGQLYSFKIGVKELGWRRRATLQENEQLISPADYVRINISESLKGEKFRRFAKSVCNERFAKLTISQEDPIIDVTKIFPGLPEDQEAEMLGIKRIVPRIVLELGELSRAERTHLNHLSPLEIYFISFWAEGQGLSVREVFDDTLRDNHRWRTRFENYRHALLFTIRKHVRGINKYYAGWDVFTQLSGNNIRYLLELVEKSALLHLHDGGDLTKSVGPKTQTIAAQNVGHNYLSELEGLSLQAAQLTKLLLGLGRVFQVMARDAIGHAPEVNQFRLSPYDDNDEAGVPPDDAVERLLKLAVMHLALIRPSGTKLGDSGDTRDYDYMVHPIYSAYFVFSHRKKRKMILTGSDLLGLVSSPKPTIRAILKKNNRATEEPLPEQLTLFEAYYDSSGPSNID